MNVPARKPKEPQVALATLEDLLAIPEEERRHELIGGVLRSQEPTDAELDGAQWALSGWLVAFGGRLDAHFSGWWVHTEVEIFFDDKNTFRPAIAGWRRDCLPERPSGTPIRIRPDLVCEIWSPNRGRDLLRKKRIYHRREVTHLWIIDPDIRALFVNRWSPEGYIEVQIGARDEIVYPEPFETNPLQVKILFGDDPDEDDESSPKDDPSPSD